MRGRGVWQICERGETVQESEQLADIVVDERANLKNIFNL
jgi:hypothetical protein